MTHSELVTRAVRWLRGTMKCRAVYAEMVTALTETPDVIGWTGNWNGAESILVECKTSRGDLFADRAKASRVASHLGPGRSRYIMITSTFRGYDPAVPGFGVPLPDKDWGLAVVHGGFVRELVAAVPRPQYGYSDEMVMLLSAIRRMQLKVPFDTRSARWQSMIVTRRERMQEALKNSRPTEDT